MPDRHAVGEPQPIPTAERHPHAAARLHVGRELLRNQIVERLVHAVGEHDGRHRPAAGIVLDPWRPVLEQLTLARMLV